MSDFLRRYRTSVFWSSSAGPAENFVSHSREPISRTVLIPSHSVKEMR